MRASFADEHSTARRAKPPADPASYSFFDFGDGYSGGDEGPARAAQAPRWDRCTTIRWAVDFAYARQLGFSPGAELSRFRKIFAETAAATGFVFSFAGRIDGRAPWTRLDSLTLADGALSNVDLVLTYGAAAKAGAYTENSLAGGVLGWGGPVWSETVADGSNGQRIKMASAVFDAADLVRHLRVRRGRATVETLYRHEIGHTLGLDHVGDPRQTMYPAVNPRNEVGRWGAGDLTGLRLLASQACFAPQEPDPGLPDPGLPDPGLPDPGLPDPGLPDPDALSDFAIDSRR